jgi:hypothetical protein
MSGLDAAPREGLTPRTVLAAIAIPLALATVAAVVLRVPERPRAATLALVEGASMTTAYLALFVEVVLCYLTWQLVTDHLEWIGDLHLVAVEAATLAFIAVVFGDWRAGLAPSALDRAPRAFAEADRLYALFTVPGSVAVAFFVGRYGAALRRQLEVREVVAFVQSVATLFIVARAARAG